MGCGASAEEPPLPFPSNVASRAADTTKDSRQSRWIANSIASADLPLTGTVLREHNASSRDDVSVEVWLAESTVPLPKAAEGDPSALPDP